MITNKADSFIVKYRRAPKHVNVFLFFLNYFTDSKGEKKKGVERLANTNARHFLGLAHQQLHTMAATENTHRPAVIVVFHALLTSSYLTALWGAHAIHRPTQFLCLFWCVCKIENNVSSFLLHVTHV